MALTGFILLIIGIVFLLPSFIPVVGIFTLILSIILLIIGTTLITIPAFKFRKLQPKSTSKQQSNWYDTKLSEYQNLLTIAETANNQEKISYYQDLIKNYKTQQNIKSKQQLPIIVNNIKKYRILFWSLLSVFLIFVTYELIFWVWAIPNMGNIPIKNYFFMFIWKIWEHFPVGAREENDYQNNIIRIIIFIISYTTVLSSFILPSIIFSLKLRKNKNLLKQLIKINNKSNYLERI